MGEIILDRLHNVAYTLFSLTYSAGALKMLLHVLNMSLLLTSPDTLLFLFHSLVTHASIAGVW